MKILINLNDASENRDAIANEVSEKMKCILKHFTTEIESIEIHLCEVKSFKLKSTEQSPEPLPEQMQRWEQEGGLVTQNSA